MSTIDWSAPGELHKRYMVRSSPSQDLRSKSFNLGSSKCHNLTRYSVCSSMPNQVWLRRFVSLSNLCLVMYLPRYLNGPSSPDACTRASCTLRACEIRNPKFVSLNKSDSDKDSTRSRSSGGDCPPMIA